MVFLTRNIVSTKQVGKGRELFSPGEFFQHAAEIDYVDGSCLVGQRRMVRPQERQPTENMGIAAQLIRRTHRRMLSGEITQKMSDCSAIGSGGVISHRSRHRFRSGPKELRQRMTGERSWSSHGRGSGMGRRC